MLAQIVAFVIPLGLDTLAVAIALGVRGMAPLRPAVVFTVFETLMPIVGIALGRFAGARFAVLAQIAGGLVLIGVGAYTVRETLADEDESEALSFGSLRTAAAAGFAISMDELAVGFPLGTTRLPIATLLVAIAIQTSLATAGGIAIGRRIGEALGRRASRSAGIAAGLAFCGLGVWLLMEALAHQ